MGSKTEAVNSGFRTEWKKQVEITVTGFIKITPWHGISVFMVLDVLKDSSSKIPLQHLSRCAENTKVARVNVGKLGFGRDFGTFWKNTFLIWKGFGCRGSTGGWSHLSCSAGGVWVFSSLKWVLYLYICQGQNRHNWSPRFCSFNLNRNPFQMWRFSSSLLERGLM